MLPSSYIIGVIIFTLVISGGMWIYAELGNTDSSFIDQEKYTSFNSTFNKYNDVQNKSTTLKETIEGADTNNPFGVIAALYNTAWNSLKLLLTNFSFMNDVFQGLNTYFGLPTFVSASLIALVVIIIIFAIIAAVLQGRL